MKRIKPDTMSYSELINDIESGIIKIPAFQRDFVWEMNDTIALLDSIYRGYPIGSFLFWETDEHLNSLRNIGNLPLEQVPEGRFASYVLDGQQRITSLYASIKEAVINNKKYLIYFDLDNKQFVAEKDDDDESRFISLAKILDFENHLDIFNRLPDSRKQAFQEVWNAFTGYEYSIIRVKNQPIEVVCDIFERINTRGKKLSVVDLMVAKTYGEDFDLRKELNEFAEKLAEFEIPEVTILQSIATHVFQQCRRKDILQMKKEDLKNTWADSLKSIELSIDLLKNSFGVKISRILPYPAMIVPVSYFFLKNDFNEPDNTQIRQMAQWFWKVGLSNRYDSAVESKIAEDIKEINKIIDGESAKFDYQINFEIDRILSQKYSLRNAFCLTILCLYASKNPKRFDNNSAVDLSKNFSKYNSREMHHVFPRKYLKKINNPSIEKVDSVANICFIPSSLNKDILDKAPSEYFKIFSTSNPNIKDALQGHLIGYLDNFGIKNNDFNTFLTKRAELIKKEFESLISV
jgi:hypothetical protein